MQARNILTNLSPSRPEKPAQIYNSAPCQKFHSKSFTCITTQIYLRWNQSAQRWIGKKVPNFTFNTKRMSNKSTVDAVGHEKIFMEGVFLSVACGGHLHFMFSVCDVTIWRHIHVSKLTFWRSLLTWCAYSSTPTHNLCVMALNINYQLSRLGYRRK